MADYEIVKSKRYVLKNFKYNFFVTVIRNFFFLIYGFHFSAIL